MAYERHELGRAGERAAETHLRAQGYSIVERNFRCPLGEVDLVALHRNTIVFIEVKTRRSAAAVPTDAVDARKQRQIRRAAEWYVSRHRLAEHPVRFDVVSVWRDGDHVRCEVMQDAFGEMW
jgi:putative endonuclease